MQQIRSYVEPTRIANGPLFVKRVVNLRGVIVPTVDLRLKFELDKIVYDDFTVVIVLNMGRRVVGVVVDAVSDVITFAAEQLRSVPDFTSAIVNDHLLAIGTIDDRMIILVDIERLMAGSGMGLFDSAPAEVSLPA